MRKTLETNDQIIEIAEKYKDFDNYLYLGRKYNYPTAREGAHKIKETAYVHAEGCQGGEPKHCELSLISEHFPSVCIVPNDSVYDKMISNIQEIKARKGPIIAIATRESKYMATIQVGVNRIEYKAKSYNDDWHSLSFAAQAEWIYESTVYVMHLPQYQKNKCCDCDSIAAKNEKYKEYQRCWRLHDNPAELVVD